jgi:hypothetical protein
VKPKTKDSGLFRFVSVFRTYIETTETNRNVSLQTETNQNNPKFSEKQITNLIIYFHFKYFTHRQENYRAIYGVILDLNRRVKNDLHNEHNEVL